MKQTLDYYNTHAQAFFDRTVKADVQESYQKFLPLLPYQAHILDAGCGSGRDSLYFIEHGYEVKSIDGSKSMVELSSKLTGKPTLHLLFQEITFENAFDAVWASASLLHIPYKELSSVLQKLHCALKSHGILFASFKYGNSHREVDERHFYRKDARKLGS